MCSWFALWLVLQANIFSLKTSKVALWSGCRIQSFNCWFCFVAERFFPPVFVCGYLTALGFLVWCVSVARMGRNIFLIWFGFFFPSAHVVLVLCLSLWFFLKYWPLGKKKNPLVLADNFTNARKPPWRMTILTISFCRVHVLGDVRKRSSFTFPVLLTSSVGRPFCSSRSTHQVSCSDLTWAMSGHFWRAMSPQICQHCHLS